MDDRVKYFLYGLIIGGKQLERVREPTQVPVQIINIGYDSDTMFIGDRQILTVSIFPQDASYQEVEWHSSDISVISINKLTPTTAEVLAVDTGDVIITCKATDGSGATGTLNMHAVSSKVYTEFSFGYESSGLGALRTPDDLIEVIYQPVDMEADRWGIKLDKIATGAESPYSVIDTPFKNIKAIKNTFDSNNYNDYFTSRTSVGYDIETYDGSGFSLLDRQLKSPADDLRVSLYGVSGTGSPNSTIQLKIGYTVNLYSALFPTVLAEQSLALDKLELNIDNPDIIEIDNLKNIKAVGTGTCTISTTLTTGATWSVTINCVSAATRTSRPIVFLTDSKGQSISTTSDGMLETGAGNKVYIAVRGGRASASGGLVEITGVNDTNLAEVTSDGGVLIKAASWVTIYYRETYNGSSGETEYTGSIRVRVLSRSIDIGTISSDYLSEGTVVYAALNGVYFANGYLTNKLTAVYNANLVELRQILLVNREYINELDTLTFNPSVSSQGGTVVMYHFVKNTSSAVNIRLQLESNPEVYAEIEI